MNFIQRLRVSAIYLVTLITIGFIIYGLSKIPHIEYALIGIVFLGLSYMALFFVTAIISFIVWLITGNKIFPKWMI